MQRYFKVIFLLLSWLIVVPLSYIIPKDKKTIVFLGRFGDSFEGNLKYFYQYLNENHSDVLTPYYVLEDYGFAKELSQKVSNVLYYPSFKTMLRMFRAHTIVVNGNEWTNNFKVFFLIKAKKVQLWHGNGMKTIGLQNAYYKNSWVRRSKFKLLKSYPTYDVVTLTSKLQVTNRGDAFNKKFILINGQPRNDILFRNSSDNELVSYGMDLEASLRIKTLKNRGYKVVIYSPTWKVYTSEKQELLNEKFNLNKLIPFLEENNIIFIFKLHPKDTFDYGQFESDNIIYYDKDSDVYPVFKDIDMMITDYSSIYMDYLLLDRPIIFFSYDQEDYIKNERELQYDYEEITPGKKCKSTSELIEELTDVFIAKNDNYVNERKQVRSMFYQYADGNSSERIYNYIIKNLL